MDGEPTDVKRHQQMNGYLAGRTAKQAYETTLSGIGWSEPKLLKLTL